MGAAASIPSPAKAPAAAPPERPTTFPRAAGDDTPQMPARRLVEESASMDDKPSPSARRSPTRRDAGTPKHREAGSPFPTPGSASPRLKTSPPVVRERQRAFGSRKSFHKLGGAGTPVAPRAETKVKRAF